jgi:hypothetical protein
MPAEIRLAGREIAMNIAKKNLFSLTVRFGSCQRYTETDGKLSRRSIGFRDCPILSSSLKGENQPARGDEIELWIHEADPGEDVIGSFPTVGWGFVQLSLPPAAFAEFWTASAAADGAARDITMQFKDDEPCFNAITKVQLVEHMPEAIDFNPKAHRYIPGRLHPVVAELREMRRTLAGSWRSIFSAFFVVAAFTLVTGLILSGLQALWKLVNP